MSMEREVFVVRGLEKIMFTHCYIYLIYTKRSYIYLIQKAMCSTEKVLFYQLIYQLVYKICLELALKFVHILCGPINKME
jgi:hypothetical protein